MQHSLWVGEVPVRDTPRDMMVSWRTAFEKATKRAQVLGKHEAPAEAEAETGEEAKTKVRFGETDWWDG